MGEFIAKYDLSRQSLSGGQESLGKITRGVRIDWKKINIYKQYNDNFAISHTKDKKFKILHIGQWFLIKRMYIRAFVLLSTDKLKITKKESLWKKEMYI